MSLSKCKRWRALLHIMIVKQQAKRKQSSLCLHAVAKYEKVENINTQNDYETMSKK